MIEEVRGRTNEDLSQTGIGFDAGYFSSENICYCHEQRLNVYVPEGSGESGVKERKRGLIESRDCRLEIDGDIKRLTCPGGQTMEALEPKKDCGNYFYRFHPKVRDCRDCRSRTLCYQSTSTNKGFSVKKEYFDSLPLREKMTEKLSTTEGKMRMADRSCLVEHVFGGIKEAFRFRRFLHRGIEKVRLVWELVCIGYNFRKLARLAYG